MLSLFVGLLYYYYYCGKNIYSEIYPLNKILGVHYSNVNCSYQVIEQTSRTYLFCITETLYLLKSLSSFPPPQPLAAKTLLVSQKLTILDTPLLLK